MQSELSGWPVTQLDKGYASVGNIIKLIARAFEHALSAAHKSSRKYTAFFIEK